MPDVPRPPLTDTAIFRRTLVVAAAIGLCVMLWRLTDLLLLLFASALVALMFHEFARLLQRRLRLPFPLALILAVILPIVGIGIIGWAFGSLMAEQFAILFEKLPSAFAQVKTWLDTSTEGRAVMENIGGFMPDGQRIVSVVQTVLGSAGTAITGLVVVLVSGVYLAAQPGLYGRGLLLMLPPARRQAALMTVEAVLASLNAWLKGQAVSMSFVGAGTALGLWIAGLPSPLAIGLVAGLCEFVPYLGVIVVSIPAVILGFSISFETGIATVIALIVVQQLQGNVVTPMAQSAMVDLPPALTVFSLIAAGVLLGPLGVILAVPLTVVGLVLVKQFVASRYGEGALPPAG
ncbi:AI-2E family transporter [Sandaracinobacteroides sp. A072]|uniref:AI-2E family transporter n=1 Tax=Sandaracinobacteroides sp. A072 TaxID=3461146 RepID=UPI0040424E18